MSLTGIRDLSLLAHPAGRSPADPHLRRRVRRTGRRRGDPAGAAPGGAGVLRPQPGAGHREGRRRSRELVPEARVAVGPRPDGRGRPRAGRDRLLGGRVRRAGLHDDHRVGHRHADGEHPRRRSRRSPRARAAPPAPGPGRAGRAAGVRLPVLPADQVLSEEAYERLRTIGEHTELGSGFKIAMRDLEIRGAGNLLGGDQSGHIAAVGYDLYVQMVTEAVAELKGEEVRPPAEIKLELPSTPTSRRTTSAGRTSASRPTGGWPIVTTHAEVDDIAAEWSTATGRSLHRRRRCCGSPGSGPSAPGSGSEKWPWPKTSPAHQPDPTADEPVGPAAAPVPAGGLQRGPGPTGPAHEPVGHPGLASRPGGVLVAVLQELVPVEMAATG